MIRRAIALCFCFSLFFLLHTKENSVYDTPWYSTSILQKAYPESTIVPVYDSTISLWAIQVSAHEKSGILYWKEGRLLPKNELKNFANYDPFFYEGHPSSIPDPQSFSQQDITDLEKLVENRSNNQQKLSSADFLFNILYDGETEEAILKHIITHTFLDWRILIHKDLIPVLNRIQTRIYNAAKTDAEVATFIHSIKTMTGYNWREIRDISNRSTHSWGISIDILPLNVNSLYIYWKWAKDSNKNWIMTPLNKRWIPPYTVISIFEEEGFIWGGKWLLWDNMHFEYRPEINLLLNK